jgi:YVTN family beta-propeller protein
MAILNGGTPMTLVRKAARRNLAGLVLLVSAVSIWSGCGDVYRPVANPTLQPGGDPQNVAVAVVVSYNGGAAASTTQIDATGDTNIGNFFVGAGPVHAAFSPLLGVTRVFVVNQVSNSISSYAPTILGSGVTTVTLPGGSSPVFMVAPDASRAYVANSGTHSVGVIDLGLDVETSEIGVGLTPVALAVTPDRTRLYVANKGSGTVSVISTADFSTLATIPVGAAPVWLAVKDDGSTVYVANQGSGTVSVIDVASNNVVATLSVGAAPRMLLYDSHLRRLYVPATGGNTVSIFNADPQAPVLLSTVTVGAGPAAVTALADGTRLYVANAGCADSLGMTVCTGNTVSIVDSTSLTVRKTVTVGSTPIWLDSANDSTKVVVANRDSNNISDIRTLDDTVIATNASSSPGPVYLAINH